MNTYRSLSVIKAVQYTGSPIPDVTCGGSDHEHREKGCDSSRRYHLHVHTAAVGGMTVLKPGDWIYPVSGGPFAVAADDKFRQGFEVPAPMTAPMTEPEPLVYAVPDGTFSASSLPPAKPEEIVADLKTIDEILTESKDATN